MEILISEVLKLLSVYLARLVILTASWMRKQASSAKDALN